MPAARTPSFPANPHSRCGFAKESELLSFLRAAAARTGQMLNYTDRDGREIDLVLEAGDRLHPVEIKKKATPAPSDCAAFAAISPDRRGTGAVVCFSETRVPLSRDTRVFNVSDL